MLIMPSTKINFQGLADGIASDFFKNGVPLVKGIAKVAREQEFTPQEVMRLTEKTNTAASLYFLKTADDKKGTFELAELDEVLKRTHPADDEEESETALEDEESSENSASAADENDENDENADEDTDNDNDDDDDDYDEIDDETDENDGLPDEIDEENDKKSVQKTASLLSVYTGIPATRGFGAKLSNKQFRKAFTGGKAAHEKRASAAPQGMRNVFALQKSLSEKKQAKIAMEVAVQDGIDYLSSEFHAMHGPDFGKFASDCLDVYGKVSVPVLKGLAKYIKYPKGELKKIAKVVFSTDPCEIVNDCTPQMRVMGEICRGLTSIIKTASEISELEQALDYFWRTAKEGK